MSIRYPCPIAPGGFCPDCTSDGPICDFDICPYDEELYGPKDKRMEDAFRAVLKRKKAEEEFK